MFYCVCYVFLHAFSAHNDIIACEVAESTVRKDENKKGFVDKAIWLLEQKVNPDKISFTVYSVL